jgi:hypothetical protein
MLQSCRAQFGDRGELACKMDIQLEEQKLQKKKKKKIPGNGYKLPGGQTEDNQLSATLEYSAAIIWCRQKIIRRNLSHRRRFRNGRHDNQ